MSLIQRFQFPALLLAAVAFSSCQLAALVGGKGTQEALFKFTKNQRVLVLVDMREGITAPPAFPVNLADKIGTMLYRDKAADHIVSQESLVALQQVDPDKYHGMGIADIAKITNADVVVRVYVTQLVIAPSTDNTVAEGDAETYVKVIDRQGTRLYPGDAAGTKVATHLDPAFLSERDSNAMYKSMMETLATHISRMFHSYSLDDVDHEMGR